MNLSAPFNSIFNIFIYVVFFQGNVCESSIGEGDDGSGSPVMYSGSSSRTNHASANGSIITMTLKNNHLIVETEERNVSLSKILITI